ncbi:N-acyl-D-amino-acid deacylase [Kitasatospora herbaricolor]|uniref:N-acyl-D-amino-acid deacylase family protein n=1 Tax=Kitasatospora herbaricolor TaxID=68217 RepID=UPI00174904AB|nr:D-aminoacylase [Kitasatospora herbaricolor]MDQ0307141.1 N-acyl-D-amino-acid deacylase [Kitasatospora herbaricolor]GGV29216.1 N-acyl-D-amino-acid deacylase [Kitasatospora herbaricolor]
MARPEAPAPRPDLLFRGATVVDGSGAERYRADVRVTDGVIAEIGRPDLGGDPAGARTVDADGLVLAPGFIDMHAHSDLRLLVEPEHPSRVTQGVTCEVLGQDGLSYAPVDDRTLPALRRQIAGWNGDPAGFDWAWRSVGEYLDRLDRGIAVNACYLVPHGTVRMLAMGWDDRPPTPLELDRMRHLLAQGLREGAVGMSSGLTYTPGMYAGTDELVALCEVVAAHGGYHAPHQRSYGAGALEGYAEMVEIARKSGCPLHLTHATMNFGVNRGRAGELLDLVDRAIADGCDLTLDSYPYLPGSTTLAALLPSWATEGGPDATLARLADPAARERIRIEVEEKGSDGCHGVVTDWATVQISGVGNQALAATVGRTVADLAAERGRGGTEVFFELLLDDGLATTILQHVGHEENVRAIMRHPAHTAGSDGLLVGARPHPRAWGTFARYLGHYSRELGVLTLEETVARMTGRPARRLRLDRRGLIRSGHHADLVLFDLAMVRDTATFDEPRLPAAGIEYVYVNGVAVVERGRTTGALPGRALRRTEQGARAL